MTSPNNFQFNEEYKPLQDTVNMNILYQPGNNVQISQIPTNQIPTGPTTILQQIGVPQQEVSYENVRSIQKSK